MSRSVSASATKHRPSPLSTKSFARYEPPASPQNGRHRATTVAATPESPIEHERDDRSDVFKKTEDEEEALSPSIAKSESLPDRFDELPIELASLTDRFVEALGTKAFAEPPSIEQISQLFQDFYHKAASSISIHIAALRLKLNREATTASKPTKRQLTSQKSSDSLAPPTRDGSQQMLTASEVAEKRKQRKLLDYKKLLLEEAVERRACEKIYDKIWRHKSTLDEVKDEKLRSKTAALALVGIGLKDLGIQPDDKSDKTLEDVQELLTPARECLMKMNDEHYPLGKLQHLTAAHKVIVDTLFSVHKSSSSADEILPTLIYTLITAPLEGINIISNFYFIQRFRATTKVDGEAAYCMTNLEAAIGFLEDVDLASLRADEVPEGPAKDTSTKRVPSLDATEPFPALAPTTNAAVPSAAISKEPVTGTTDAPKDKPFKTPPKPLPSPRHQRTLSDLLKPVQNASDIVRSSARDGLDTISSTLDNSFKFLSGRLKEQITNSATPEELTVPKTLDEARQLVSRPLTPEMPDDGAIVSESSSVAGDPLSDGPDQKTGGPEDRILSLFGGRRATTSRDRSADRESIKSNSSGSKKVAFAANESKPASNPTVIAAAPINPLEQVKNFSSSLNPLSHLGSAFGSGFKGFGRPSAAVSPSPTSSTPSKKNSHDSVSSPREAKSGVIEEPQLAVFIEEPQAIAAKIKSVSPPVKRFVELQDAGELKIKDVSELLVDYQRLAHLLNELAAGEVTSEEPPS